VEDALKQLSQRHSLEIGAQQKGRGSLLAPPASLTFDSLLMRALRDRPWRSK